MARTHADRITEAVACLQAFNAISAAEVVLANANAALWGPRLSFHARTGARGIEHIFYWGETKRRRAIRGMRLKYCLLGAGGAFLDKFNYWEPATYADRCPRRLVEGQIQWLRDHGAAAPVNPAAHAALLAQAAVGARFSTGHGQDFIYGDTTVVPNVCYNAMVFWWLQAGVFSWSSLIQPGVASAAWGRNRIANALILAAGANPALDKYPALGVLNPAVAAGTMVWLGLPNTPVSDHVVLSLGAGNYYSVNTPNAITPGVASPGPLPVILTHAQLTAICPAVIPGVVAQRRMVEITTAAFSANLPVNQWER